MGLGKKAFEHIATTLRALEDDAEVLCLGEQDIYFDENWLRETVAEMGRELPEGWQAEVSPKKYFQRQGFLTQRCVFESIGFKRSFSLDLSSFEGCDFIHDLNDPQPPEELCGRFGLIIDGGTLEHVFHVPNALTAIHRMLKTGGIIAHHSPTNNYVDHGFFSFSPTFFADYYQHAGYEFGEHWLVAHLPDGADQRAVVIEHQPGDTDLVGRLDYRMYATLFWAKKRAESLPQGHPNQGFYRKAWD